MRTRRRRGWWVRLMRRGTAGGTACLRSEARAHSGFQRRASEEENFSNGLGLLPSCAGRTALMEARCR
jgi:hypothetical protein